MKLLLTSAGISNTSIGNALVDLLGKPIQESTALCIPTAIYGLPGGTAGSYRLIHGVAASPLCELGWKALLDEDLAELYVVETKQLKRQVRRNIDRFPDDFMFELTKEEFRRNTPSSWSDPPRFLYASKLL